MVEVEGAVRKARLCSLLRFETEIVHCQVPPLNYAYENIGMVLGRVKCELQVEFKIKAKFICNSIQ